MKAPEVFKPENIGNAARAVATAVVYVAKIAIDQCYPDHDNRRDRTLQEQGDRLDFSPLEEIILEEEE